jgi:uncharacterized membrane protein required for colicin V production
MKLQSLSIDWFDLVLAAALFVGVIRGRKRGMSGEMLPLLQWVVTIVVAAFTYAPLGKLLQSACGLSATTCNIAVWIFEACILGWAFTALKHAVGDKISSADAFGKSEYYLGMLAGMARYVLILLFALSIVNAFYVSEAEKAALAKVQKDNLGSITLWPGLGMIQDDIFKRSLTGPVIMKHLGKFLMQPSGSASGAPRDNLRKRRERELDDITNPK